MIEMVFLDSPGPCRKDERPQRDGTGGAKTPLQDGRLGLLAIPPDRGTRRDFFQADPVLVLGQRGARPPTTRRGKKPPSGQAGWRDTKAKSKNRGPARDPWAALKIWGEVGEMEGNSSRFDFLSRPVAAGGKVASQSLKARQASSSSDQALPSKDTEGASHVRRSVVRAGGREGDQGRLPVVGARHFTHTP